jgi:hypothetical protein
VAGWWAVERDGTERNGNALTLTGLSVLLSSLYSWQGQGANCTVFFSVVNKVCFDLLQRKKCILI